MAVIMNTSVGDIVIDLHADLCPLTSKNFLKLCKMKYYNHCLFHDIKKDFIAQTGDPTGTGSGGDSLYKHLYGDQARFFNDEIHPKLTHAKIGTVAMASAGENLNASQFYITLRPGLDYLDGKHTVFGEVAEGLDVLMRINEAFVDDKGRPLKNIRIKRVDILDDPFDDPPQLAELIPDMSPELRPPAEGEDVRLEDDWVPMDERMDPEELDKSLRKKEAQSRAVVLEMIGDLPEADVAPPENVLFICKLNPVTEESDLETIFSRFGKIISADIIKDYKTGESLCYGFIEFDNKEACEAAYFKMDNVLIDDRRIHVDFSQSVAKLWTRFRKFGTKDTADQGQENNKGGGCFICGEFGHRKKDCPNAATQDGEKGRAPVEKPKYTLKESGEQRGNPRTRYDMVFDDDVEDSRPDKVRDSATRKDSRSRTAKHSNRISEDRYDERRTGGGSPENRRYGDQRHERYHSKSTDHERTPLSDEDRKGRRSRDERHERYHSKNTDHERTPLSDEDRKGRRYRDERHERYHSTRTNHERTSPTSEDRKARRYRDERHERYQSRRTDHERLPPSNEDRKGRKYQDETHETSPSNENTNGRRRSHSPRRERLGERRDKHREITPLSDEVRRAKRSSPSSGRERHGERKERRRER